jgi:polyhydroxybutyrate depolymerase
MRWLGALLLLLPLALPARAEPVPPVITIADGTYRAILPPQWDGKRALPLVLYLHGFREDSAQVSSRTDLVAAVTSLGALMVIPDGLNQNWSHQGAPRQGRDDIAFLHHVIADAAARWPVDQHRIFAAGFSIGASMVWDLACRGADGFAAFLPFSGDFWLPYPKRCDSGPILLRHTHAVNDHTFPMSGRALGNGFFHQGDLYQGWAILEATDGCAAAPDARSQEGELQCQSWTHCRGGKELELCLHSGDHQIAPDWLHAGVAWALQRVAARS